MLDNCKNCNSPVNGNYCSNCGQSAHYNRINMHFIMHEMQHSIFHIDKGILYTLKELAIRPGSMLREYLNGKRIQHFKPFGFVLVIATLYAFLSHIFNLIPDLNLYIEATSNTEYNITNKYIEWVYSHYSIFCLLCTPFYAIFSYLFFKKEKYNYLEHLIINLYISGFQIFLTICLLPLVYFYPTGYIFISTILSSLYYIFAYVQLFNNLTKVKVIVKSILISLLTTITAGSLIFLIYTLFYTLFFKH